MVESTIQSCTSHDSGGHVDPVVSVTVTHFVGTVTVWIVVGGGSVITLGVMVVRVGFMLGETAVDGQSRYGW